MASETQLPLGWVAAPLFHVLEPRGEKASPSEDPDSPFLGMDHVESHTTKILDSVPASTMKSTAVRFRHGDVLYGKLRPYLNKVALPYFDGLASAEFIVLPGTELVTSSFLKHRLNAADFVSFATHLNEGDRPRVSFDQIGEFQILIPPPREQRRIAAKIDELFSELDNGIDSLKTAFEQIKVYRQTLLKQAFEGKLSGAWREHNKDQIEASEQLTARIKKERTGRYERRLTEWKAAVKKWEASGKTGKKPSRPRRPTELPRLGASELAVLPTLPKGYTYTYLAHVGELERGTSKHRPRNAGRTLRRTLPFHPDRGSKGG